MLRLGCCCYICKRWFFVDSQEGLLSSRGGGDRHTGTRLTVSYRHFWRRDFFGGGDKFKQCMQLREALVLLPNFPWF